MRIQYKGGIWKNSEDEILKAAVMKYGMNQWSRIASLLVRKSATQCKARWYEWLDPSIKKTAWTREEEEQLLHLAKIMPTQWRSIAPMIGRTATQCLEHYEKLLEQAQRGDEGGVANASAAAGSSSDPRRGRDGDFAPESKPARPDPVDMDEDEMEMLGEARARLANTKGKKAKRKEREKQLAVAKDIAHIQKRRELKAAGISVKSRRRDRKEPDLAVEIPFQRPAVPGFYDTRAEDVQASQLRTDVGKVGKLLEKYEGKRHEEVERAKRKNDEQRRREYEERNPSAALGLNPDPAAAIAVPPPLQGTKLNLPKPQVSDAELEAIAKAGALFASKTKPSAENGITDRLVPERNPVLATPSSVGGDFSSVSSTPRTIPTETWADARQRHVQTILNLQNADTPLVGGQNTPLPARIALDPSATPVPRTPNPLSTPSEMSVASGLSRRQLAKAQKLKMSLLRKKVQGRLDALTKPEEQEYEFNVAAIEDEDEDGEGENDDIRAGKMDIVEDAEQERKRLEKEGLLKLARAKRRALSLAARRRLPLPDENWIKSSKFPASLRPLVLRDIAVGKLLTLGGGAGKAAAVAESLDKVIGEDPAWRLLRQARALVKAEASAGDVSMDDFVAAVVEAHNNSKEWILRQSGDIEEACSTSDLSGVLAARELDAADAQRAQQRVVNKLGLVTNGYHRRLSAAEKATAEEWDKLTEVQQRIACVVALEEKEKEAMTRRVKEWEDAVREQKEKHIELQREYAELTRR